MKLARDIISLYHTKEELVQAEENFKAIYQKQYFNNIELPIITYNNQLVDTNGNYSLIDCIFSTARYKSKGEVRRLIIQGAVKINGQKTYDFTFTPVEDLVIQVGKGNIFKLKSLENEKKIAKSLKK